MNDRQQRAAVNTLQEISNQDTNYEWTTNKTKYGNFMKKRQNG